MKPSECHEFLILYAILAFNMFGRVSSCKTFAKWTATAAKTFHAAFMAAAVASAPNLKAAATGMALASSASEPALKQLRPADSSAPASRMRQLPSPTPDDVKQGTRPEEYYKLVSSLSDRSLGYLELLSGSKFTYQHMSIGVDRPYRTPQPEIEKPSPADMRKYMQLKEAPFRTHFMDRQKDRKIQHMFSRSDRWGLEPQDFVRVAPGDFDPGTGYRSSGPMARLQSRRPRASYESEKPRHIGPGTYNPKINGLPYLLGEYDENIPSALTRTARFPSESVLKDTRDYEAGMPVMPRAPGHRCISWAPPDPLAEEGRSIGALGASSSTDPTVGPGTYKPRIEAVSRVRPGAPAAVIIARPIDAMRDEEVPAPNAYYIPSRPLTTVPAGKTSISVSFADRPYLPPSLTAEQKAIVATKQADTDRKIHAALTPEGRRLQRAQSASRFEGHKARLQGAAKRRLEIEAARDEEIEALRAAIEARPTAEDRKAQRAAHMETARRQSAWMMILKLCAAHQHIATALERSRNQDNLDRAARVISTIWEKSPSFSSKQEEIRAALSSSIISRGIKRYIARNRRAAENAATTPAADLIKEFLMDSQRAGPFVAVMQGVTFRIRRLQAQWRRALATREARLAVAVHQWDSFDGRRARARHFFATLPASAIAAIPSTIKRAKLKEWLRKEMLEYRKRCKEYYEKLLPQVQEHVERKIAVDSLRAAMKLLSGSADAATVSGAVLADGKPSEGLMKAMVRGIAGAPPYFRQSVPLEDLARLIEEAIKEQWV